MRADKIDVRDVLKKFYIEKDKIDGVVTDEKPLTNPKRAHRSASEFLKTTGDAAAVASGKLERAETLASAATKGIGLFAGLFCQAGAGVVRRIAAGVEEIASAAEPAPAPSKM